MQKFFLVYKSGCGCGVVGSIILVWMDGRSHVVIIICVLLAFLCRHCTSWFYAASCLEPAALAGKHLAIWVLTQKSIAHQISSQSTKNTTKETRALDMLRRRLRLHLHVLVRTLAISLTC